MKTTISSLFLSSFIALAGPGCHAPKASLSFANSHPIQQGSLVRTPGQKLNVAILGEGFFEVWMPDGRAAYTRNGRFKLADDGRWTTADGFLLQSGFSPILPGDDAVVAITANGQVLIAGKSGGAFIQTVLFRFPDPSGLEAIGPNLFVETEASETVEMGNPGSNGFGFLIQGFLESLPE